MATHGSRSAIEPRAVPQALQRAVAMQHPIGNEELGMGAAVANGADHAAMVEHAHRRTIGQGNRDHLALGDVRDSRDVLERAHAGSLSRSAAWRECHAMLAHFTRMGKRDTPLNAAISP